MMFSVKALNQVSMRIVNIPVSWVSCEAPDTARCVQNALEVLQSAVLTPQSQPDLEGICLCLLSRVPQ